MPASYRSRVLFAWLLPLVLFAGSFALLLALNVLSETPTEQCLTTRSTRCQHNGGAPDPHGHGPLAAVASIMITAITAVSGGGGYVVANLAFYVVVWPLAMGLLTVWAVYPLDKRPPRRRAHTAGAALALVPLSTWTDLGPVRGLYWFCTDAMVNLGNLLGISYLAANGLLFAVIFPGYTVGMFVLGTARRLRHRRARRRALA